MCGTMRRGMEGGGVVVVQCGELLGCCSGSELGV